MLKRRFFLLVLGCLLGACSLAQTPPPTATPEAPTLTKDQKSEIVAKISDFITTQAFVPGVDLSKWPTYLGEQQDAIDKADTDFALTRAINAALHDFGVSHIRLLPPRAAEARTRSAVVGVGFNSRPGVGGLSVTMVYPGSPAEGAGIKTGDVVTEVDGKAPDSATVLTGDEGTNVKLMVKSGTSDPREISLVRKSYSVLRVDTLTWDHDDGAILRIHTFALGYRRSVIEDLMTQAAKAKFLVIDLRSNGGGSTSNLNHLLSLLLPPDTVIGTFVSRRTMADYKTANNKDEADPLVLAASTNRKFTTRRGTVEPFHGKIAVLINRGSASASEICTTALRDSAGALVVGQRSAGAVLSSVFRRLVYGYELQFPIEDYVSGKGVRLEKNPIVPDIDVVQRAEEGEPDPAVVAAFAKLRSATQSSS